MRGEDKNDLTLFNTGSDFLVKVVGQPLDAGDFRVGVMQATKIGRFGQKPDNSY
ncbi:hypothetical protein ACTVKH_12180 [Serratia marcescens]|uniref:hypothetical protein n=1 Tax=Serratia marcescens TaxID=615 RepID=UPI003FA6DE82